MRCQVTVGVELEEATSLRVEVYDVLGRRVLAVREGLAKSGQHTPALKASHLADGVYLFHSVGANRSLVGRVTVLR